MIHTIQIVLFAIAALCLGAAVAIVVVRKRRNRFVHAASCMEETRALAHLQFSEGGN